MNTWNYILLALVSLSVVSPNAAVIIESLPERGLQPQAITSADGTVHLIYLRGEPASSDVVYRILRPGEKEWSEPLRVNSQPGSAIAIGTIRGAQFALGRNGRVHAVWNGSQSAEPKPGSGSSPMLYARLNDDGKGFSAQKNLITATHDLDGGGSIAADGDGRVFVFWYSSPAGGQNETNRAVYMARSTDDGNTFAPERPVSPPGSGACGCCGLTASANGNGDVHVLFRSARSMMQRDMVLLGSSDRGETFQQAFAHPWMVGMCPMSSASLAGTDEGTWATWETAGRVHLTRLSNKAAKTESRAVGPPTGAKHPRLATNARGETLVVWVEGTGWQRGGSMAWQVFDASGEPTADQGKQDGISAWSYATAYAQPDGRFVILH